MTLPDFQISRFTESHQQFHAAGRLWVIPEIRFTVLPDGSTGIDGDELDRIHTAILNEICGEPGPLAPAELDFILDVAQASLTELAQLLRMDKSSISRWRSGSRTIPSPPSWLIKRWAWYRTFGADLAARRVNLGRFKTDVGFLSYARRQAIKQGLTSPVSPHISGNPAAAGS